MKNNNGCRYEVKITVGKRIDGTPIRKSFYGKSKREAKAKAEEYLIENGRQTKDPGYNLTYRDIAEAYFRDKETYLRPNSLYRMKTLVTRTTEGIGDRKIVSVTKPELSNYVNALSEKYTENYVKDLHSFLASVFKFAVENGWLSQNPCVGIKYKVKNKAKERRVYTQEETDAILEYTYKRPEGLSVHLMLSYGTTISETLGMQYADVDFDAGTISIERAVTKVGGNLDVNDPKNKHRKRVIAISSDTVELIRRTCDPSFRYLIHADDPEACYDPQRWRWQVYSKFMQAAQNYILDNYGYEIDIINPHELRHTRATLWVEQDRNLFAIAEEMGWSDLQMLKQVYGHPDVQKIKAMLGICNANGNDNEKDRKV